MNSNLDKIRNFLIQSLRYSGEIALFANYFTRIEENFAKYSIEDKLEDFLLSYLTIYLSNDKLNLEDLYVSFKTFYDLTAKFKSNDNILKHIYRYSTYYLKLTTAEFSDVDIKNLVQKINKLEATDTYSYLMEILEDFEFSHINKNTLLDVFETVVAYVAERQFNRKKALPFAIMRVELNKMLAMDDYIPNLNYDDLTDNTKNVELQSVVV